MYSLFCSENIVDTNTWIRKAAIVHNYLLWEASQYFGSTRTKTIKPNVSGNMNNEGVSNEYLNAKVLWVAREKKLWSN